MTNQPRRISLDATLRDGEQAPGNATSPEHQVDMALRLEALGVDVIEAGFPGCSPADQIQICGMGSDVHLVHKRGISRAEAIAEVDESLRPAVELGATDILFGVEDASRGEYGFIHALADTALEAGAGTIILADTTGCATPQEHIANRETGGFESLDALRTRVVPVTS